MRARRLLATTLTLVAAATVSLGAKSGRDTFTDAWDDRLVLLKRTLFSVVFDERSRTLLFKREGLVTGLTVGTPSDTYYQFDARRDTEDDILDRDPNRVVSQLQTQYRRSTHLEIGNVRDVEPVILVRYEPGVKLVVRKIQFERSRVRLSLHKVHDNDLATTLTVRWPAPLSKELTEAKLIDDVLSRFVTRIE